MKSPYERLSFAYTRWRDLIYLNWGIDRSQRARFADAWRAAMAEHGWLQALMLAQPQTTLGGPVPVLLSSLTAR